MTKTRKPPAIKVEFTGVAKALSGKKTRKPRAAKPPPGADPLVRMLPCPLNASERSDRAMEAAEVGAAIDTEIKLRNRCNEISNKLICELREKAHQLRQQAVDGVELRQVQCEEITLIDDGKVVLMRSDTNEWVEDLRQSTTADLNGNLFEPK